MLILSLSRKLVCSCHSVHRLPSNSSVFRFRCSSLLLWIAVLALPSGFTVMGMGVFHSMDSMVLTGAEICVAAMLLYVAGWFVGARARCPLCLIPPLHQKKCQKDRRVKRLFSSYRLKVATDVLFKDYFRCPYCGEATKVASRGRR